MSEQQIEQEIQEKGLNAPRLTPDHIDAQITSEQYFVFPGTTVTICLLTLRNGFTVTGESACASPENFNEEIGRKIAREQARDKIWALEGYRLKETLYLGGKFEASTGDNCTSSEVHCADAKAPSRGPVDGVYVLTEVLRACSPHSQRLREVTEEALVAILDGMFPVAAEGAEHLAKSIDQLRKGDTIRTEFGEDGNLHPVADDEGRDDEGRVTQYNENEIVINVNYPFNGERFTFEMGISNNMDLLEKVTGIRLRERIEAHDEIYNSQPTDE